VGLLSLLASQRIFKEGITQIKKTKFTYVIKKQKEKLGMRIRITPRISAAILELRGCKRQEG
jgi:hypothetical protein